jgi:FixJ family two-component response regulator
MSGLDFQRRLAETGVQIPIIFITAHGDIPMSVRALKSGAVEFLTKPFRDQDLLDAIHLALQRDSAALEQKASGARVCSASGPLGFRSSGRTHSGNRGVGQ